MDKFVFLFDGSISRGFVEENAWLRSSSLESITLEEQLTNLDGVRREEIAKLMELFCCSDIPLGTSTKNYSGG
jgi:hypothetical protein